MEHAACPKCGSPLLIGSTAGNVTVTCGNGHETALDMDPGYGEWFGQVFGLCQPALGLLPFCGALQSRRLIAEYQLKRALGMIACLVSAQNAPQPEVTKHSDELKKSSEVAASAAPTASEPAESDRDNVIRVTVYTDGSCHPNPGFAGCGAVLIDEEEGEEKTVTKVLEGSKSNNEAEYEGIIAGIKLVLDYLEDLNQQHDYLEEVNQQLKDDGPAPVRARLTVKSDSELVVKQLKGEYQTNPKFDGLQATISDMIAGNRLLESVTFEWTPGDTNPAHKHAEAAYKEAKRRGTKQ